MHKNHTLFRTISGITIFTGIIFIFLSCSYKEHTVAIEETREYRKLGSRSSQFVEGPHLIYHDDLVTILSSHEQNGQMKLQSRKIEQKDLQEIEVFKAGFLPRRFSANIKNEILPEPTYFETPDSIFAVSDIEGNFNTLINLLQQNQVIDEQLNWRFATGHFVFIGDIFDRGNHVTEMLWFLYRMEAQAKQAGGYVHILLGNHEIFNLRGDLRYVEPKYLSFAQLTEATHGINHTMLFDNNSELGIWLRSKNVIEKIGSKLFVHAGISPDLVASEYSLEEINRIAHQTLDTPKAEFGVDERLIWGKYGPTWYRGYFEVNRETWGPRASQEDVNSSLKHFNVEQVFVGHSHVEKPELRYGGKICAINVVPPADHLIYAPPVQSYGVLIRGSQLYRADENGILTKLTLD